MTNVARSLDENLQTRQGPIRSFLILAKYASRAVFEEKLEGIRGWSPLNAFTFLRAWVDYMRVGLRLKGYELYLDARRLVGMGPLSL
jgi:hypothetical protein